MADKLFLVILNVIAASSPALAAQPSPSREGGAPKAPADAEYCLRVDPLTGSRIETVRCETREGWAQLGVDVDQEWDKWGVRIIPSKPRET